MQAERHDGHAQAAEDRAPGAVATAQHPGGQGQAHDRRPQPDPHTGPGAQPEQHRGAGQGAESSEGPPARGCRRQLHERPDVEGEEHHTQGRHGLGREAQAPPGEQPGATEEDDRDGGGDARAHGEAGEVGIEEGEDQSGHGEQGRAGEGEHRLHAHLGARIWSGRENHRRHAEWCARTGRCCTSLRHRLTRQRGSAHRRRAGRPHGRYPLDQAVTPPQRLDHPPGRRHQLAAQRTAQIGPAARAPLVGQPSITSGTNPPVLQISNGSIVPDFPHGRSLGGRHSLKWACDGCDAARPGADFAHRR